ncbi:glycosyltransferase family 2 protein [Candidatus Margulisiibacteriota bacterium]
MTNRKTISVIMSNYNYGQWIGEALEAILTQSFSPIDVIVIDDASTDNSVEVVEKLMKKYPNLCLLRNEKNIGGLLSVKRGLEVAKGEYVYSASSDDKVLPGFFEKSMCLLEKYPEAGLCCSDVEVLSENGDIHRVRSGLGPRPQYFDPAESTRLFLKYALPPILPGTAIVKRSALDDAGGYMPDLKWTADLFAHIVICSRYGFCYIPEAGTTVRVGVWQGGNVTGKWHVDRDIIKKAIEKVKTPRYKDVLPMFRRTTAFSQSSWEVLMVVIRNKDFWDFMSFRLLRFALFDKFVKRTLLKILPHQLYMRIAEKVKRIIRKVSWKTKK